MVPVSLFGILKHEHFLLVGGEVGEGMMLEGVAGRMERLIPTMILILTKPNLHQSLHIVDSFLFTSPVLKPNLKICMS